MYLYRAGTKDGWTVFFGVTPANAQFVTVCPRAPRAFCFGGKFDLISARKAHWRPFKCCRDRETRGDWKESAMVEENESFKTQSFFRAGTVKLDACVVLRPLGHACTVESICVC